MHPLVPEGHRPCEKFEQENSQLVDIRCRPGPAEPAGCDLLRGRIYREYPRTLDWRVSRISRPRPQSVIFGVPSSVMRIFSGLISRWITPFSWASAIPRAIPVITESARSCDR